MSGGAAPEFHGNGTGIAVLISAMKKTLILDSNSETGLFHSFLLTLAGHRITEVRSPADALSRILAASRSRDPFHLLVISNYPPSLPFETFIEALREGGGKVPVLVFRRPKNPAPSPLTGVVWCMADDALETISALRLDQPSLPVPVPGTGADPLPQDLRFPA